MELIRYLYSKPIVDANEIATALEVNISAAHRLIQDFEKLKILIEQTGYKRNVCLFLKITLNYLDNYNCG